MLNLANLAKLAAALQMAPAVRAATTGDRASANRLMREMGPSAASILAGSEGAALFNAALTFADRQGWTGMPTATVREVGEPTCAVCAPWYDRAGERRVVRDVTSLDGGLIFILGLRKTGKTALASRICELWERRTFAWGISQDKLPDGWRELRVPVDLKPTRRKRRVIIDPDEFEDRDDTDWEDDDELDSRPRDWLEEALPQRSSLIVDDAGIVLDSASSGGGAVKAFKHLVQIIRHLNVNCVVNTQYSSAVTKYALDADAILLKPPPMMWEAIERPEVVPFILEAKPMWDTIPRSEWKHHAWAISSEYRGPVHITLPTFWSDTFSYNKRRGT